MRKRESNYRYYGMGLIFTCAEHFKKGCEILKINERTSLEIAFLTCKLFPLLCVIKEEITVISRERERKKRAQRDVPIHWKMAFSVIHTFAYRYDIHVIE